MKYFPLYFLLSSSSSSLASRLPEQGIVKFSMPDKSIRSLLVKRDETAKVRKNILNKSNYPKIHV